MSLNISTTTSEKEFLKKQPASWSMNDVLDWAESTFPDSQKEIPKWLNENQVTGLDLLDVDSV